jgi:hypothetical protein
MHLAPCHRYVRLVAVVVTAYLATDLGLWEQQEHTVFAFRADRVCVRSIRTELGLRHQWIARSCLRKPVTVLYWPVNALRTPRFP